MNYRMIVRMLSITLRIVALLMLPALVIAMCCHENAAVLAFAVTILPPISSSRKKPPSMRAKALSLPRWCGSSSLR